MGSGLWNSLKAGEKQPPTNIVNADIIVVEEINDGQSTRKVVTTDTTPQPLAVRPKFKPAAALPAIEQPVAQSKAAPSNNFDLVGDDIGMPPEPKRIGRPRLYPSNAAKQAAYRERKTKP